MSFRPMPVLSVFALASLIILILLGNWQYSRYQEKLARAPSEQTAFETVRVEVDTGNAGMAQQVYGIIDGEAVWRRYVPGRINGEGDVVLALWDATSGTEPVPLAIAETGPIERPSNVFFREAAGGMGTANRPEENRWFHYDPAGMMQQLGYGVERAQVVEPDEITIRLAGDLSRSRRTQNPYATAEVRDPLPPQRHFGYALTWWGMAAALLAVYVALHHSKGRLSFRG